MTEPAPPTGDLLMPDHPGPADHTAPPPPRDRFLHNVVAHPLLWLWPRLGRWIHDRTEP